MYDLAINIPAGRRPGKYLRRLAPEGFGQDYSAIVDSLPYQACTAGTAAEWRLAAKSCHSCQSGSVEKRRNYAKFWRAISGVRLAVLKDAKGRIVARALVRPGWCTYAPIYGAKHYLLEARLRYAGYTPGSVATPEEIQDAASALGRTVKTRNYLGPDRPRSKRITEAITVASPAHEYMAALALYHNTRRVRSSRSITTRYAKSWWYATTYYVDRVEVDLQGVFAAEYNNRVLGLAKDRLARAEQKWRAWCRQCQLAGIDDPWSADTITRTIIRHEPVGRIEWRGERTKTVSSTVYIDDWREFLTVPAVIPAGWYKL